MCVCVCVGACENVGDQYMIEVPAEVAVAGMVVGEGGGGGGGVTGFVKRHAKGNNVDYNHAL